MFGRGIDLSEQQDGSRLDRDVQKLRILAIHRYFWPDTPPYASILRRIASRWVQDGHCVEVLSTQPSYKADALIQRQAEDELMDGFNVHRMSLLPEAGRPIFRAINAILFSLRAFFIVLQRRRYDVVMISTAPPIIGGWLVRLASKLIGAHFVYHCMDVHPEIGRISGEFRNPLLFAVLRWIDAQTCRGAARVVVLSKDMEFAIKSRPGSEHVAVSVINNFSLPEFENGSNEPSQEFRKPDGMFRVIFAGNLGRFQGLETFIDAMKKLESRTDIEFVFLGAGKASHTLQERAAGMANVRFFPHQSLSVAKRLIADADLCVVSLIPGVVQYAYPSKTMAYLQQGRPILVSVEPGSALARMVEGEAVGSVVAPGDADGVANAILKLVDDRALWLQMRKNAEKCGAELFAEAEILDLWSGLLQDI